MSANADDHPAPPSRGGSLDPGAVLVGTLHLYVAFDWGDGIDLARAGGILGAEAYVLPRRRRTPTSIAYRPAPVRCRLEPVALPLPDVGAIRAPVEITLFDFGAVSVAVHVPIQRTADQLRTLAAYLADPPALIATVREVVQPLFDELQPTITDPQWQRDLFEEYFVFQLPPGEPLTPAQLLSERPSWLAGLLRLEAGPLSNEEIEEALRLRLSYSPDDLFFPDWAAAVLLDRDCEETLQALEFANLQLLEFRHIDNRLDDTLAAATRLLESHNRSRLRLLIGQDRSLRQLGELKVEANGLFERTGNVLKLVGDQYLARVYRQLAARLHLKDWERNIQRKLEVAEGIYQVMSDQAAAHRTEFLEIIVIVLIALEIVMAFFRH